MHTQQSHVQALNDPAPHFSNGENVAQRDIESLLPLHRAMDLFYVADGVLFNLVARGRRALPGKVAGTQNGEGYLRVRVDGVQFRVHRIVWLITYGRWPEGQIDHINGVRDDNRIENLREVSVTGNQQNQHVRVDNTSGVTGVFFDRGVWVAKIRANGKRIHLGQFKTKEAAAAARKAAEALYGFHPNHGRSDTARRNGLPSLNAPRILRTA